MKKYKVLTDKSENLQDFKDWIPKKTWKDFAGKKIHIEHYCHKHMKDRLMQYCKGDTLVDVILTGTDIHISQIEPTTEITCHNLACTESVKYVLRKHDKF